MGDYPDWSQAQQVTLFNDIVPANGLPNGPIDISRYAALMFILPSKNAPHSVVITQNANFTGTIGSQCLSSPPSTGSPTFIVPVVGTQLTMVSIGDFPEFVAVIGLAAPIPKQLIGDYYGLRSLSANAPSGTASGTFTDFTNADTLGSNPFPTTTGYYGSVALRWAVNSLGGASQLALYMKLVDDQSVIYRVPVETAAAVGNQLLEWGHPFAFIGWSVGNTGALTSAMSCGLTITPASN